MGTSERPVTDSMSGQRAERQRRTRHAVDRPPLTLRTFPPSDATFQGDLRRAVVRAVARGRVSTLAHRVQTELRGRYPGCVVRVQEALASSGDDLVVYGYREGTVLRSVGRQPEADTDASGAGA